MKVMLLVSSEMADWALVDLDDAARAEILARRALLLELQQKDPGLASMAYHTSACTFFESPPPLDLDDGFELVHCELPEEESIRTDLDEMVIAPSGVSFQAVNHYGPVSYVTVDLSYDVIVRGGR